MNKLALLTVLILLACGGTAGPGSGAVSAASPVANAWCLAPPGACPPGTPAYRAFSDASWWNKRIPADAPIDSNNARYIADAMDPAVSGSYMRLTGAPDHGAYGEAWSYPIYWAQATDPSYTIQPTGWGPQLTMRIPYGATPQSGYDGALIVFDLGGNSAQELYQARYDALGDRWTATATKLYVLNSNGLDKRATGSDNALNDGHRGVATPIRAVRLDEVRSGAINRRLECFWHATGRPDAATPDYYWPMVDSEDGQGGVVPQGIVLRIKPSVNLTSLGLSPGALVIARALQEYGCIIGDNDGGTNNSIKLQRGPAQWAQVDPAMRVDSLSVLNWSDWEFIQGGYDPPQPATTFYTLTPCRLFDTRGPDSPTGGPILAPRSVRSFPVTGGGCGVPATAAAISVNVTAVQPGAAGHLTLFPGNWVSGPLSSNVNFSTGQTRANNAVVPIATDGSGSVNVLNNSSRTVHVVLDVNGYFE